MPDQKEVLPPSPLLQAARLISRKEAKAAGVIRYNTGKACVHGHLCERDVKTKRCVQCNREKVRKWQIENPARVKAGREMRRESINESIKRSKAKNPEKYKTIRTMWLALNGKQYAAAIKSAKQKKPEKYKGLARSAMRKRRAADPKKYRAISRRQYWTDPKKANARAKAWRQNNPEKMRAIGSVNHARRKGAPGRHDASDIREILIAQKQKCAYFARCGNSFYDNENYHVDHITPISRGGANDRKNLQVLCPTCNQSKHARDPLEFSRAIGFLL